LNQISFRLTSVRNVEKKNNSPVNIRFLAEISDIRHFSQNIRSDVKTSEMATMVPGQVMCNMFVWW